MEAEMLLHLEEISTSLKLITGVLVLWGFIWFFHQ